MTSAELLLNMLPHWCWNTWRNVRTLIKRTDNGTLDQLVVTHLVKNLAWILWNPMVYYHNCNGLLVIPIHSQLNQAHTFWLYLFILHYLPCAYVLSLPSDIFCSGFLSQISCLPSVYCTSQPSCIWHDFRLLLWCKCYCCSSGMLRGVEWFFF